MKARLMSVLILILLVGIAGAAPALAQDDQPPADTPPNYGSRTVQAGFVPDPLIVSMLSGGPVNIGEVLGIADCTGFATDVSDFQIQWTGETEALRIFFVGSGDTTLVVQTPSGDFLCNDDFEGTHPLVEIADPAEGTYDIWVGSYTEGEFIPGYLMISELASSPLNILSPLIAAAPPTDTSAGPQTGRNEGPSSASLANVQYYTGLSVQHTESPVDYDPEPPVGGPHSPSPLTCGVYTEPVPNENAVHSLEHGAIWITYQPGLSADQVSYLQEVASGYEEIILSPYPGLQSPVVVSAWGAQLPLSSADDPALIAFLNEFSANPTAPEPLAGC